MDSTNLSNEPRIGILQHPQKVLEERHLRIQRAGDGSSVPTRLLDENAKLQMLSVLGAHEPSGMEPSWVCPYGMTLIAKHAHPDSSLRLAATC